MGLHVETFFEPVTATFTHVLVDEDSGRCAVIDPVLDYDSRSARTATTAADRVVDYIRRRYLETEWILETHVHADHLTASAYLKRIVGGQTAIGTHVREVQDYFRNIYNAGADLRPDGSQFDRLLNDGDVIHVGALALEAMHTPGHTPACMAYRVQDVVFVGDIIFMPDVGTARCDFPGGDPRALYRSVRRILGLPRETRLFLCHDYPPEGREVCAVCTVTEERASNTDIHDGVLEEDFVAERTRRDRGLELPRQMLPALQVNIRAGEFPPPESNGVRYLKLPLNLLGAPE